MIENRPDGLLHRFLPVGVERATCRIDMTAAVGIQCPRNLHAVVFAWRADAHLEHTRFLLTDAQREFDARNAKRLVGHALEVAVVVVVVQSMPTRQYLLSPTVSSKDCLC